jgi:hypothetical protein
MVINMLKYIAVFKTLSYANKAKGEFSGSNCPDIIKTPKPAAGGCSYSLVIAENQLKLASCIGEKNKKGFLGIYKETAINEYKLLGGDFG